MIPASNPAIGSAPDPIAIPKHNGKATKKTIIPARKSLAIVAGDQRDSDIIESQSLKEFHAPEPAEFLNPFPSRLDRGGRQVPHRSDRR
jgi:hypothetical protein